MLFIEHLEGRRLLAATGFKFVTKLEGADEVPPRDTRARGSAVFKLNRDGTEIRYVLKANRISNVVDAHIHVGTPDVNGPVTVDLLPAPPAGTRPRFVQKGVITGANLIGPLAGMTLVELVAAMRQGNTYVNVHTSDLSDPPDTGPGDFPGGEIRGQIRPVGRAARPEVPFPTPQSSSGGQGNPNQGNPDHGDPNHGNPPPVYTYP